MSASPMQILIVVLLAVLLFGGRRIAGFGKDLGSGLRAFKDGLAGASDDEDQSTPATSEAPGRDDRSAKHP